jgi:hypothetical protein
VPRIVSVRPAVGSARIDAPIRAIVASRGPIPGRFSTRAPDPA